MNKILIYLTLPIIIILIFVNISITQNKNNINIKDYAPSNISDIPVFGIKSFSLGLGGKVIASNKITNASTKEGVLVVKAILISSESDIRINNNGKEFSAKITGNKLKGSAILSNGDNYISIIIYKQGIKYSRSICVLIKSDINTSVLRYEITWSKKAILDVHIDDGKGNNHCYYGNKIINKNGWNMKIDGASAGLDLAAITGEGPISIRVFGVKSGSTIRCYVNYYSGNSIQNVTVRLYQNGTLTGVYNHTFSPSQIQATSMFHAKSWVVEEKIW